MRMSVSTVLGLAPGTEVSLFGTEGTIKLAEGDDGFGLWSGRRGDDALKPVKIAPEKVGAWRVEEEFINAVRGTEAVTRVIIDSEDGQGRRWSTVGVSANIVDASFEALLDAILWKLIRDDQKVAQ